MDRVQVRFDSPRCLMGLLSITSRSLLIAVTRYGEKLRGMVDVGWDHHEEE
jgi:hypothetical protein